MRINTNIASMTAQESASNVNKNLSNSLEKLSSGLRINKAADDASGMAIADKLRTQASSIGQSIENANSANALVQIADKAMAEQSNILDIIKTKLIQASTATTSAEGRDAIRKDILKLQDQLDNISDQTNYNGTKLLQKDSASGTATISTTTTSSAVGTDNQTMSIADTQVGTTTDPQIDTVSFTNVEAGDNFKLEVGTGDTIQYTAKDGDTAEDVVDALVSAWNLSTGTDNALMTASKTGTGASATLVLTADSNSATQVGVTATATNNPGTAQLDTIDIGTTDFAEGDKVSITIGATTLDYTVNATDGITADNVADGIVTAFNASTDSNFTPITAAKDGNGDVTLTADAVDTPFTATVTVSGSSSSTGTEALNFQIGELTTNDIKTSGGVNSNRAGLGLTDFGSLTDNLLTVDIAEAEMAKVDTALNTLNGWRSDFGSTQNQLDSSIRNMMTTQTNIKAAESVIRDVDYAAESANFNKQNIIAQAGTYAMSQANAVQQNVMRLLQ